MATTAKTNKPSGRRGGGGGAATLRHTLANALAGSLLPAERELFTDEELRDAATFVLSAGDRRLPGEAAIAIDTVGTQAGNRHLRIVVVNDDMPFLVDSIAAAVASLGLAIERLAHPVVGAARKDERLTGITEANGGLRESMVYLETERADAKLRRTLANELAATLADVRVAVDDWQRMKAACVADAERLREQGEAEGGELLRWFAGGMLTQLGHVTRHRDGRTSGALGVCRKGARGLLADASYDRAFDWFDRRGHHAPLIVKANVLSRVHRRVPLDLFLVPIREQGSDGAITAISIHAGIWTSAALSSPPDEIPVLRAQLARLADKFDFDPAGHAGKALVHALTALPHDLVIGFGSRDLERVATTMMSLIDRPRPKLVLVTAPLARHLFAFVWMPRDNLSTGNRLAIQAMVEEAAQAKVLDWSLQVEGGTLTLLRFVLDIRESGSSIDEDSLDAQLKAMLRGWSDAVEAELAQSEEPGRAAALAQRYAEHFEPAYRNAYDATEAASDIRCLRHLSVSSARGVRLRPAGEGNVSLKVYQRGGTLALSDVVPALENFGFRVLEEVPYALTDRELGTIHDFTLALPEGTDQATVLMGAEALEAGLASVLNGEAEDDPFNRLTLSLGLHMSEANWLRAWFRYLRQTGMSFAIQTVVDALRRAPEVTRGLINHFVAAHDTAFKGKRDAAIAAAEQAIRTGLASVGAINDDRLLRSYAAVVGAILRTNAFAPAGREALAFKLQSDLVPGLPRPVPWREIWVYSRRVEGIHLRAGPVARGGLRWSDRRDDFRTEILGLMKAQRVKNAVIVPTGAKGGFYPKRLPDPATDRDGWMAEGTESYRVFIRSLLSITDNIVGQQVVHPAGIVIRDGDDPYFVVAADKGTASFSDVANAIAESYDFWLDDAFASGGSKGYDHKAMGITAKGAWLSVQRHFSELGIDVQSEPVTVAGVGDMSGDVFGNGMLLSKAIHLVAAFDHRHIFLDPTPDPAKSWAERKRLFDLPRSSWADYDAKLISKGGGVFPRSQKAIPLSLEVRAMLDLEGDTIDPDGLMHAILGTNVDLLWFGGIGTYIKAASEANSAVGDPANDAIRIDGEALRCKVIGEGANLGCTQAGRIAYSLMGNGGMGGRINTDFIDNSAGVDCSDHEVNIKIALAAAKRSGKLSEAQRVKLLSAMTDDVAALVLEDNRLQALALSIAEAGGAAATPAQLRLIEQMEDAGQLDRRTEGLAANDVLLRRALDGHGLTRPELAVLLSSLKLALQDGLERSRVVDDPSLESDLVAYFPTAMRRKFAKEIVSHRLRREILATVIANRLVNRLGVIHPFELAEEEGASLAGVSAAFLAAEQLFDAREIWRTIDASAMPEAARLALFDRLARALRGHMADLLRAGVERSAPGELAARLAKPVARLAGSVNKLLNRQAQAQSGAALGDLVALGAPEDLARSVLQVADMDGAVGLAGLSLSANSDPIALTRAFSSLGQALGLDWAQLAAVRLSPSDPWERLLVAGLARDFQQMRLGFLARSGGKGDPGNTVADWLERHADAVSAFRKQVDRAQAAVAVSPAMLAQLAGQARTLLERRA